MDSKQQFYMDFLQEEGYRPSQDEDGDIVFKHEAVTYLLFVEEEDTNYFRLVYPAFWEISTPDEEEKAATFTMDINAEMKVVKLYQLGDKVWAGVEMFCEPIDNCKSVFQRCLRVLQLSSNRFCEMMRDSQGIEARPTELGFNTPTDGASPDDETEDEK